MGAKLTDRRPTAAGAPPDRAATDWLRRAAWASLLANIGIVVTGGVVRLTGSGLGCPTWPRCTDASFVPHQAMGVHSAIEFGNRMLTFVVAAVAVTTFVLAWRHGRPAVLRLAFLLALGVPAQAVIGGVTVLTDLNPWVVSLHLLVSLAMVGLAVTLLRRLQEGDGVPRPVASAEVVRLARGMFALGWVVLYVGTVVTGSGPHAGDAQAPRNGLDPAALSQAHADLVFVLVGLTVALAVVVHAGEAAAGVRRAVDLLLAVEVLQATVGLAQTLTRLPEALVALHLLGAALVAAALTWLLVSVRERA
ncbi:MAG: COX15/CtaA family protein [Nocardioidaceae bacterium]